MRSVSAVGEQYVELLPRTDSPPYLQDGSVIAMGDTKIPQQVSPMLDQVSTLINSIPKDKLSGLIDESFNGLQRGRLRPRLADRLVVDRSRAISTGWPTARRH